MNSNKKFLPYLLLFIGTLCIGWSAIFVTTAHMNGVASAFYRVAIALCVVMPWWLFSRQKLPALNDLLLILLGGVLFGMDLTFWNVSILLTSAATSTVLANFAPVWVGLGAMFFFREKLGLWFWVGTALAIGGIFFIIGLDKIEAMDIGKGNLFALTASFFYAMYLLVTQKSRQKMGTLTFMTFATLGSTVTLLVSMLIQGISFHVPMDNQVTLLSLAGLGIITHVGGWLTINYSLGHIKSSVASVTLLSQAVWTGLIAIPVLGQVLSWHQIVGAIIVLLGVFLVNWKK